MNKKTGNEPALRQESPITGDEPELSGLRAKLQKGRRVYAFSFSESGISVRRIPIAMAIESDLEAKPD